MNPNETLKRLKDLNSMDAVQDLFTELNFEPAHISQSEINLKTEFIESKLLEKIKFINLINEFSSFYIFFCKLELINLNKGRLIQREIARKISKKTDCIIVFSNNSDSEFRIIYVSAKSDNNIKLSGFTISKVDKLRTASEQISKLEIGSNFSKSDIINHIKVNKIFDIEPVTEEFFEVIKKYVDLLSTNYFKYFSNTQNSRAFALQFFNRLLFLKYIEKKKWLNGNINFLDDLIKKFDNIKSSSASLYTELFKPLFFYAFSKNKKFSPNTLPEELKNEFENLPYLNGGLFEENDLDIDEIKIGNNFVKEIFSEILNKYNFTITEDTPLDREIAIDPEMLGLIYEGLVNAEERSDSGIFYTPRVEVDFMCKKSILHFLESDTEINLEKLINLIFSDYSIEENSFSILKASEKELVFRSLVNMNVVDPACGSGAFLIGIIQNLIEILLKLENINLFDLNIDNSERIFKLKKDLIEKVIHGVDIKLWAVQIAELRLWLYLIGDYEGSLSNFGKGPILPSLEFKIRQGDSLLSEIEGYPIILRNSGFINYINPEILKRVKEIQEMKIKYYYHDSDISKKEITYKEFDLIKFILNKRSVELKSKIDSLYQKEMVAEKQKLFEDYKQEKINYLNQKQDIDKKEKILSDELLRIESVIQNLGKLKERNYFIWEFDFADIFFEKGGFDIVIGNPPYVRQEEIAPPLIEKDKINADIKSNYKDKLINNILNIYGKEIINTFNRKSDYYVYFYFISLSILKEKGIFTFINSSSWLDVEYGTFLQEFLLKNFKIIDINDNQVKRSFKSADVNTIIISVEKPDKKFEIFTNIVKFINHKVEFENSIILNNVKEIFTQNNLINNEYYRMIVKKQSELLEDGIERNDALMNFEILSGKYSGSKWGGKYFRAPDIYYKILEKGEGKLVPLKEIAKVRFGIKTGANEFFYLKEEDIKKWKIEEEFLQPIIFSLKEIDSYEVNKNKLKRKVIICNLPKEKIKNKNLLKYILYGEKNNFNQRPTCASRNLWYSLGKNWEYAPLIFPSKIGERMPVILNSNIFEDKKLYGITPKNKDNILPLAGILNCSLCMLFIELSSRQLTGAQAISDIDVNVVSNLLILDIFKKTEILQEIQENFNKMITKKSSSIFIEYGVNPNLPIRSQKPNPLTDRKAIDDIIFDILDLSLEDRKEVYWAVCELVQNRLNKARSV